MKGEGMAMACWIFQILTGDHLQAEAPLWRAARQCQGKRGLTNCERGEGGGGGEGWRC